MTLDQDIDKFLEKIKDTGEAEYSFVCIGHLMKSTIPGIRGNGWGDCSICKPDAMNMHCAGYRPIKIRKYIVQ